MAGAGEGLFLTVGIEGTEFDNSTLVFEDNTVNVTSPTVYTYGLYSYRRSDMISVAYPESGGFQQQGAEVPPLRSRRARTPLVEAAARRSLSAASDVDWTTVSDATARSVYGKSTIAVTRNTFEGVPMPWAVQENYGIDFIAAGNAVTWDGALSEDLKPNVDFNIDAFAVNITIAGNTLTVAESSGVSAYFDVSTSVPVGSVLTVSGNIVTTDPTNAEISPIVRLSLTTLPKSSLLTIAGNALVAADGTAGVQPTSFVVAYMRSFDAAGSIVSPARLCGNTVFGTPIDTDELTESTFYMSDDEAPLPLLPIAGACLAIYPPAPSDPTDSSSSSSSDATSSTAMPSSTATSDGPNGTSDNASHSTTAPATTATTTAAPTTSEATANMTKWTKSYESYWETETVTETCTASSAQGISVPREESRSAKYEERSSTVKTNTATKSKPKRGRRGSGNGVPFVDHPFVFKGNPRHNP